MEATTIVVDVAGVVPAAKMPKMVVAARPRGPKTGVHVGPKSMRGGHTVAWEMRRVTA